MTHSQTPVLEFSPFAYTQHIISTSQPFLTFRKAFDTWPFGFAHITLDLHNLCFSSSLYSYSHKEDLKHKRKLIL